MNCQNCKTKLSCQCKERKASNGKMGCTKCIDELEKSIAVSKQPNK